MKRKREIRQDWVPTYIHHIIEKVPHARVVDTNKELPKEPFVKETSVSLTNIEEEISNNSRLIRIILANKYEMTLSFGYFQIK